MSRQLRPLDDDNDRDKPRNKRRYAGKEKRPDTPDRDPVRGVTRSRAKDEEDWNDDEDWSAKELDDLDDDLDLDDEDEEWSDLDEDEDSWEDDSFDDDDDR